jgi:hypothetical protein
MTLHRYESNVKRHQHIYICHFKIPSFNETPYLPDVESCFDLCQYYLQKQLQERSQNYVGRQAYNNQA